MQTKKIIAAVGIGAIMVLANLVMHESGHAVTATKFGGQVISVNFFGLQVYPKFLYRGFHGYLGQIKYDGFLNKSASGWVLFFGSGATWLASIAFLIITYVLYFSKIRNFILETIALFGSLMFLDMLTYILGLRFTGLKEPLTAARSLGWDQNLFVFSVFALGAVQLFLAVSYILKSGYWKYFLETEARK